MIEIVLPNYFTFWV